LFDSANLYELIPSATAGFVIDIKETAQIKAGSVFWITFDCFMMIFLQDFLQISDAIVKLIGDRF
jgi:hypothetical protein